MKHAVESDSVRLTQGTDYPEPFDRPCRGARREALGNAAGLTQFGVNRLCLAPGAWSSQRHYETGCDEFVYVLSGEVILVTDAGEEMLQAGDVAGFKAGVPNGHHLQNRGDVDAWVLEVGTRVKDNVCYFSDIDMMIIDDGAHGYTTMSGAEYPARSED